MNPKIVLFVGILICVFSIVCAPKFHPFTILTGVVGGFISGQALKKLR